MRLQPPFSTRGFSLVEVTLALGVAVFALLVIVGILPVGIGAQQTSLNETTAVNLTTGIIADLRETPTATAIAANSGLTSVSARYGINLTKANSTLYLDESGTAQPSANTARYKATITLTAPSTGTRTATYGSISVSWPPTTTNPLNSVVTFVGLNRN